jgi:hypothetical protein
VTGPVREGAENLAPTRIRFPDRLTRSYLSWHIVCYTYVTMNKAWVGDRNFIRNFGEETYRENCETNCQDKIFVGEILWEYVGSKITKIGWVWYWQYWNFRFCYQKCGHIHYEGMCVCVRACVSVWTHVQFFETWRNGNRSYLGDLSCPSVCPHETTRFPLESFLWNLIFEVSSEKSVEKIQVSLKSNENNGYLTWRRFHIYDDISLISS